MGNHSDQSLIATESNMPEIFCYLPGECKQVALSRGKTLRPLMERDGPICIQKVHPGDFLIIRGLDSNKLEVYTVVNNMQHVPVVSKPIRDGVIRTINANKTLKNWLTNDDPIFPKGLLWSGREVTEDKYGIAKWYGLHLFIPELSKQEVEEIVLTFNAVATDNQFVKLDTQTKYKDLTRPVVTFGKVENTKVERFFNKILPKGYSEFIIDCNGDKDGYCNGSSKINTDWRYATELPEFISVGVLYHDAEAIRFTDIILIDDQGNKQLKSMYNLGQEIVPTDENLLLFGYRIDDNIERMVYVVHRMDPRTGNITSSWKLFKRKKRK